MASQIIGCMVANELLENSVRPAGSLDFGPVDIPDGFGFLGIMFDLRNVISLTAQFNAMVEVSYDGGQTWESLGGGGLDLAVSGYRIVDNKLMRSDSDPQGPGPVRCFGEMIFLKRTDNPRKIRGTLSQTEASEIGVTVVVW